MAQKEGVDALVKEYLLSRGYMKTVAELDLEASRSVDETTSVPAPAAPSTSSSQSIARQLLSNVAEDIYILGMKDRDTSSYFTGYDSIRSWAVNSIDIVKPQLLSLCFPIFVHCYLGMVRLGFQAEAQTFLNDFRNDYAEYYAEELQHLSSLTSQEQYNSEDFTSKDVFISNALASKFIVRLSSLAYNLLTLFLVQSDLVLIASIINNKISFKKLDDAQAQAPSDLTFQEVLLVELPGYTAGSKAGPGEFVSIPLGVPGTVPKIQRLLGTSTTAATLATANLSLPSSKEDGMYRDLINKIVRPRSVLSSLAKRTRSAANGNGSEVPPDSLLDNAERLGAFSIEAAVEMSELGETNEEAEQAGTGGEGKERTSRSRSSAAKALTRGDPLEPSVIFATVTNAYEGMTCMHITPTVSQMATGHRDSSVRVWRLNPSEGAHFGKHLKKAGPNGEWGMNEVLPKTKRMLQEEAETLRSGGGAYSGARSSSSAAQGKSSGGLPMLELRGHSRAVYGVSQDCSRGADDRLVLSCSADETIRLWDTAVSQCVGKYSCVSPSWSVAFSPLGYHFASANQDKTATVFATDRITPLRLLTGHVSDVNCVSWHGNATLLATGSDDKTARLWDIRTSHSVRLLRGCATPISSTAISPLGNLLAAGSDNGKVYVWDLTTTRPLAILQGHEGAVHSVSFSSDGSGLCSGGADCSVRVWDLQEVVKSQVKLNAFGALSAASATVAATAGGASSSAKATTVGPAAGANLGYFDSPQVVLAPQNSYFTKFSPVFHVGYTVSDLLYAGGPFSLASATAARGDSSTAQQNAAAVTEQETIAALGISHAVQTTH